MTRIKQIIADEIQIIHNHNDLRYLRSNKLNNKLWQIYQSTSQE